MASVFEEGKKSLIEEINRRVEDRIIEKSNADLIIKLTGQAENLTEAIAIAELGTTYKRTGFHFDKRLEKTDGNTIKFFRKNDALSFSDRSGDVPNKLIIGDNYDALLNLLIEYKGQIDVIYIDPPYGKDKMGDFAKTNYDNAITRDNLLSMLYPRLLIAKRLLNNDGIIFCSIDDKNQAYLKCLMDEIFSESSFLFCIPRITKKGGKTAITIQKNTDYILGYSISRNIIFNQMERDESSFEYEDQYVEQRGRYKLTQPLDYGSLSYSPSLDYPLEYNGKVFYPGGDKKAWEERQKGNHSQSDWTWRWTKSAVEWGIMQDMIVLKNDRIYTKTYTKCRKKQGKNELIYFESAKAYSTLSFIDNKYSNDNGKKELDKIFNTNKPLFKNPKPTSLVGELIYMVCDNPNAIILDFFAGSGTTGQAVLELNRKDGGKRKFILCNNNEITETTPNGVAYDVTTKRLKRTMTGSCYDGSAGIEWLKEHDPLGGSLDVYEIDSVANFEKLPGKSPFDVIDETLYGKERFKSLKEKIEWVCNNFEGTQKSIENDVDWEMRVRGND